MSIIDKFLDVMRLNDDDYEFDNEDYDYDEEEDYEVKEKKPSRRERKKEEEQQQILLAIRGHRRKHEGMEPIEELFYDSDKRSRMCHSCPAQKQCNWTEEEKNMEIEI